MGSDSLDDARARSASRSRRATTSRTRSTASPTARARRCCACSSAGSAPDVFQKGVRAYLDEARVGQRDLRRTSSRAMTAAAGHGPAAAVRQLRDAERRAAGVVRARRATQGRAADARAHAAALPADRLEGRSEAARWQLPVCVRWGAGKATGRDCTMLDGATGELAAARRRRCPDWVLPERRRASATTASLPKGDLRDASCSPQRARRSRSPSASACVGDVNALVASGDVPDGRRARAGRRARRRTRAGTSSTRRSASSARSTTWSPTRCAPNYERLHPQALPRARAASSAGSRKPGEDDEHQGAAARRCSRWSPATARTRADQARRPSSPGSGSTITRRSTPELVGTVLGDRGAATATRSCSIACTHEAKKATDRRSARRLLGAMGAFTDPEIIAQAMALLLTDEFDMREARARCSRARSGIRAPAR